MIQSTHIQHFDLIVITSYQFQLTVLSKPDRCNLIIITINTGQIREQLQIQFSADIIQSDIQRLQIPEILKPLQIFQFIICCFHFFDGIQLTLRKITVIVLIKSTFFEIISQVLIRKILLINCNTFFCLLHCVSHVLRQHTACADQCNGSNNRCQPLPVTFSHSFHTHSSILVSIFILFPLTLRKYTAFSNAFPCVYAKLGVFYIKYNNIYIISQLTKRLVWGKLSLSAPRFHAKYHLCHPGLHPSATSSTIIRANPSAAPIVPMLLCTPS